MLNFNYFRLFAHYGHHLLTGSVDEAVKISFPHESATVAIETELADFVILRMHDLLAGAIQKPLEPEYLHHCPIGLILSKRLYIRIFRIYDYVPFFVFETVEAVTLELPQAMVRR